MGGIIEKYIIIFIGISYTTFDSLIRLATVYRLVNSLLQVCFYIFSFFVVLQSMARLSIFGGSVDFLKVSDVNFVLFEEEKL